MGFFEQTIDLFTSDQSGEDKSNGMMIMLRLLMIVMAFHMVVIGVFVSIRGYFPINVAFLGAAAILAVTVIISFHLKNSDIVLFILVVTTFAVSLVVSPVFGWRNSCHNFLYLALMLCWYDSNKSVKIRLLFSGIITALICGISLYSTPGAAKIDTVGFDYRFMLILNTVIFSACLCTVAYFLCKDNIADERKLILYNEKLKQIAGVDPLTGLMNRREIGERFEKLSSEDSLAITIVMGDIDFFKKVNDTRGHDCGDYVLKTIAQLFQDFMKEKGYVSRWGGEEFLFVFSGFNGDDTYPMMEELRKTIENYTFSFFNHEFRLTMTFGVEEYSSRFGTEEAIKKADEKLYIGKEQGRNKVVY